MWPNHNAVTARSQADAQHGTFNASIRVCVGISSVRRDFPTGRVLCSRPRRGDIPRETAREGATRRKCAVWILGPGLRSVRRDGPSGIGSWSCTVRWCGTIAFRLAVRKAGSQDLGSRACRSASGMRWRVSMNLTSMRRSPRYIWLLGGHRSFVWGGRRWHWVQAVWSSLSPVSHIPSWRVHPTTCILYCT